LAERVFVHVGTPKSGTTYLQAGLWAQREELRAQGLLFPGRTPFDHNRASILVRQGRHLRIRGGRGGGRKLKVWSRFLRQAESFDGTVVLSNEWYLAADPEQAAAAVEQLGGDRVHVVVTTRNLVRLVPAAWQESLKVGRGTSLGDFVAGLDDPGNKWTWDVVDPAAVVRRWAGVVGPERVHTITMPEAPASSSLLWDRFCETVGLAAGAVAVPPRQANESLSVQAARLLQEFGPALRDEIDRHDRSVRSHSRWLRSAVVRQVLTDVPGDPIGVGPGLRDALAERSARSAAALRELGSPVIGDLDELLGGTDRDGSRHPDDVTEAELLEASRALAVGLLGARMRQTELPDDESPDDDDPDAEGPDDDSDDEDDDTDDEPRQP
jgi:hypothetical protein